MTNPEPDLDAEGLRKLVEAAAAAMAAQGRWCRERGQVGNADAWASRSEAVAALLSRAKKAEAERDEQESLKLAAYASSGQTLAWLEARCEAAESRVSALEAELEKVKGALDAFLEVAPALPKVHRWLDQADAEDVFDLGLRHRNGKGPTAYLTGWLGMFRSFAYATKDDSWGELEKLICIVMRNYVRMIAAADKARAALTSAQQGAEE